MRGPEIAREIPQVAQIDGDARAISGYVSDAIAPAARPSASLDGTLGC
jgi:hypothetical protein